MQTQIIYPDGTVAMEADGRPLSISSGPCVAVLQESDEVRHCSRRGWFALRQPSGAITQPLCSTHVHRLATSGGRVAIST